MKQYFYSNIIEIESLFVELENLELSDSQKKHLSELIDSNLHHTVLDAILEELPEEEKEVFIKHTNSSDHDKIWNYLNGKADNIEEKIKKAAKDLKIKLHQDLEEAKRK
jgi:hypothetical protein